MPRDEVTQYWDGSRLITQEDGDDSIRIQSPVPGQSRKVKVNGLLERPLDFQQGRFWGILPNDLDNGAVRLDLMTSPDAKAWSRDAWIMKQIPEGRVYRVLPMMGDTYLLIAGKSFVLGEKASPFALARRNGTGELHLSELLDLALKYPWFTRDDGTGVRFPQTPGWQYTPKLGKLIFGVGANFMRTPDAILLPDMATGWMWVLPTTSEHPKLTCVRLFPSFKDEMLAGSFKWEWAVLGIQPRPDGHFLIASRSPEAVLRGREEERQLKPITSPAGESPEAQADRQAAQDREVIEYPKVEWWDLDPKTCEVKPEPTPPGAPFELRMAGMVRAFRFKYQPIEQVVVE